MRDPKNAVESNSVVSATADGVNNEDGAEFLPGPCVMFTNTSLANPPYAVDPAPPALVFP
jgi:hypothetical protein